MSVRAQRCWSGILLGILTLTLAGALGQALAACADCCHEMPPPREAAPCQSTVSIQCCDDTLALPVAAPVAPESPRAVWTPAAPAPAPQPLRCSGVDEATPPLHLPALRSTVLRL